MCSRLRRCRTVARMPMQNRMWARIRDINSISHAWILAPCFAPVRRKMFMSYVWIFALLLLHINKTSGQNFLSYYPSFSYCTRFLLFAKWFTLDNAYCYTKLHLHYTNISWELFFFCVIVLGNKAHKTSWNYAFLGYTPNHFGELISVKQARKTPDDYTKIIFGNIAMSLWETYVWIFAQFPAHIWGKEPTRPT